MKRLIITLLDIGALRLAQRALHEFKLKLERKLPFKLVLYFSGASKIYPEWSNNYVFEKHQIS